MTASAAMKTPPPTPLAVGPTPLPLRIVTPATVLLAPVTENTRLALLPLIAVVRAPAPTMWSEKSASSPRGQRDTCPAGTLIVSAFPASWTASRSVQPPAAVRARLVRAVSAVGVDVERRRRRDANSGDASAGNQRANAAAFLQPRARATYFLPAFTRTFFS